MTTIHAVIKRITANFESFYTGFVRLLVRDASRNELTFIGCNYVHGNIISICTARYLTKVSGMKSGAL